MDDADPRRPFSLLTRPVPGWAELRVVTIEPGQHLPFLEDEWRDALVVVEQGAVGLECVRGGRRRFTTGAVLWLFGEPLRLLHNDGDELLVIAAVSRRDRDGSTGDRSPPA